MKYDVVRPNVSNFVKSLRDMGYTFEIAVADVLDNSISAKALNIHIDMGGTKGLHLALLDDGTGMSEKELIEAMRLGSKDPDSNRSKNDLGRFGLGLKTASFSQAKKLTVITKYNDQVFSRQWDLDFISKSDDWNLITPTEANIKKFPLYKELLEQKSGTLVIWQSIDTVNKDHITETIYSLREHLSLVFHRFLEGEILRKRLNISVNGKPLLPFNPFNEKNSNTQWITEQKIKIEKHTIIVQPYILPHYSKLSNGEYEKYATEEGYTKTQGFYLYREGRLLIHGTWWGLTKMADEHRLVRIKVDIKNEQDYLWNIDVKKSTASPDKRIKEELRLILNQVLQRGKRVYTGRKEKLQDRVETKFWNVHLTDNEINFTINRNHPLQEHLLKTLDVEQQELFESYIKGLEAFIPLFDIQAHLIEEPHKVQQEDLISDEDILNLAEQLKAMNLNEDYIQAFLKTELFKNKKEVLTYE
ncbi:ATP-binding protein [Solibacillus sp. NPDC093137]|uniref:ATP-binding protein n=1 Tax=Solibacillus sp. NPDC093137 TaxID=3390678 RepID=UPI003D0039BB